MLIRKFFSLAIALSLPIFCPAQWAELRNQQTPQQIALMKSGNVKTIIISDATNGGEIPQAIQGYDKAGRLLRDVGAKAKMYYAYDAKGNLTRSVDSAGPNAIRNESRVAYDASGRPVSVFTNRQQFDITYKDDGLEGVEVTKRPKGILKTYYSYDDQGRLRTTESLDGDTFLVKLHKIHYNDYGFLVSEVRSSYNRDGTIDSFAIINTLNNSGVMIKCSVTETRISTAGGQRDIKTISRVYSYAIDQKGMLTGEALSSSIPAENYKKAFVVNPANGLRTRETWTGPDGKVTKILAYKYEFY